MLLKSLILTISGIAFANISWAHYSTAVLPKGVNNPQLRVGQMTGLDQKYSAEGKLQTSGDFHTLEFNSQRLSNIEPKIGTLVAALNSFGAYDLGSKIHMGSLRVDSEPKVNYNALIWAYGLTDSLTLGFGLPVLRYQNKIRISQTANNLSTYKEFAKNSGNQTLIDAFNQLESKSQLGQQLQNELQMKGYAPLQDQDSTFLGDLQLAGLWQFLNQENRSALLRLNLNLATGPKYDADNLAALNQTGRTYLESILVYDQRLIGGLHLLPYASLRNYLPEQVQARVPKNEEDFLPDSSSKESVQREIGRELSVGSGVEYRFAMGLTLESGYEIRSKQEDRYLGSRQSRYDLLSKDSDSQAQIISAGVQYSSVDSYLRTKKNIPMKVGLSVSDTISGKNIERTQVQELSLHLYF